VLERNRFYRGPRPHHVDRFVVDLQADPNTFLDEVESGKADWGFVGNLFYGAVAADLAKRYGVNRRQFFVRRGLFLRMFVLNTSQPLFRGNAPLRRAVNFAVERTALEAQRGPFAGTPIDHYLSPDFPGYRHVRIYPRRPCRSGYGRAPRRAPAAGWGARGRLRTEPTERGRSGTDPPTRPCANRSAADDQAVPSVAGIQAAQHPPGEPFDIGWIDWLSAPDPSLLDCLFNGKWIGKEGGCNWSYFNSPLDNRLLNSADRLAGAARDRAFGRIDLELARDAAPAIPYAYDNSMTLVSRRTGCVVLNPDLDLDAVCLKG
jgi:ABC-type transport system substrate-binding protein